MDFRVEHNGQNVLKELLGNKRKVHDKKWL